MNALLRHVSVVPFTASVGLSCRAEIARPGQAYAGTWVMTLGRGHYAEALQPATDLRRAANGARGADSGVISGAIAHPAAASAVATDARGLTA